mmetsp:Transcript_7777/g.13174  ORF Transcript_7777/g.13174 Transcript_7777/m.13174 type:complete len:275 (-) Transcript_7777:358-1182(-)
MQTAIVTSRAHPNREEFSAKNCESTIYLGNFKNKNHKLEQYDSTALTHSRTLVRSQETNAAHGTKETRFHKGFERRQKDNIHNEFTLKPEDIAKRDNRMAAIKDMRKDYIRDNDKKNGYNIINGQANSAGPLIKPVRMTGPKQVGDGLGPEAPARGQGILRESNVGRFFAPQASGHNHAHRQATLYKEGLLQDKYTSVLGVGKKDMRSAGVEDQFSKSEYQSKSAVAQTGLYESRIPGKYTPRQIPNHPSGNPAIVEKWTTNIDLNDRTARNQP